MCTLARFYDRQNGAVRSFASKQRIEHGLRQRNLLGHLLERRFQDRVQQRERADDEEIVLLLLVEQSGADELSQAPARNGGGDQSRRGRLARSRYHQQGKPSVEILISEHGHGVPKGFDLALQSKARAVDVAQQLER